MRSHTHTNTSTHTHTCTHSHGCLHTHTLSEDRDSPPTIMVKGFNYTTPTPVINPPPSRGGVWTRFPRVGAKARRLRSPSGREDLGTRVAQCSCWASRSRGFQERMGSREEGRQRGWILPGNQACYNCSFQTGPKMVGQQQPWVARQAGERTFPVCFTVSRFRQEGS